MNASSAYLTFLGNSNPDTINSDVHYYNFRYGDNAFFVLDTRRYRTEAKAKVDVSLSGGHHNSTTASAEGDDLYPPKPRTMLGEKQLTALYSWLGKVNSTTTFKFIVSSVPFTTLWKGGDGAMESWAAYPEERNALLDVLEYVPNVIVISGDRHEFAVIEMRGKVLEISSVSLLHFTSGKGNSISCVHSFPAVDVRSPLVHAAQGEREAHQEVCDGASGGCERYRVHGRSHRVHPRGADAVLLSDWPAQVVSHRNSSIHLSTCF